jgi:hypothetical protein
VGAHQKIVLLDQKDLARNLAQNGKLGGVLASAFGGALGGALVENGRWLLAAAGNQLGQGEGEEQEEQKQRDLFHRVPFSFGDAEWVTFFSIF